MFDDGGFQYRPFGRNKTLVSPIGLAGSTFGLKNQPEDVYRKGLENGINIFFWDPSFKPMTNVLLELSDNDRSKLFICAINSFGGPNQIRNWMRKRLDVLKLDKVQCLLLGWVRSRWRIRQSVLDELMALREEGLCDNIGLSIHKRSFAYKIYEKNIFDIFMLRYNAANCGLETDFFDKIKFENRPSVMTYTTTRWGKLLKPPPNWEGDIPRPGDLYRFPLSHKMVDVALMSPGSIAELDSNLKVLQEGKLSDEEDMFIRKFGDAVYNSKSKIIGDNFEHSSRI